MACTRMLCSVAFAALLASPVLASDANSDTVLSEDAYAARKAFYEKHWEQKIEKLLAHIPGVVVSTQVTLATELAKQVTTELHNGSPIVTSESESERIRATSDDGRPIVSLLAQGPGRDAARNGQATKETERHASSQTTATLTTTVASYAGLTPTAVSASIAVPRSFVLAVANSRSGESSNGGDTISAFEKKIVNSVKTQVEPLLPEEVAGKDDFQRVTVVIVDDLSVVAPIATRSASREINTPRVGDLILVDFETSVATDLGAPPVTASPRYAARVTEVSPNGHLAIESQREWTASDSRVAERVTGEVDPADLSPDRAVSADRIARTCGCTPSRPRRPASAVQARATTRLKCS